MSAKKAGDESATEDEDEDNRCPANKMGPHIPNLDTVKINREGDAVYIDVLCAKCFRAGCITKFTVKDEVQW